MSDIGSQVVLRKIVGQHFSNAVDFYLQPIFNLSTFKCIGAEVLMRGVHHHTIIPPAHFLGQLQCDDSIIGLGNYIMERAFEFLQKDILPKRPEFFLGINVTTHQLNASGFAATHLALRERYDLPAGALIFEITDSQEALSDVGIETVNQLHAADFSFAWDDVATVEDMQNKLQTAHCDYIKLDRECLRSANGERALELIGAIHEHHVTIVAEGVETMSQTSMLLKNNVSMAQGFLFSRPMNKKDFLQNYIHTA